MLQNKLQQLEIRRKEIYTEFQKLGWTRNSNIFQLGDKSLRIPYLEYIKHKKLIDEWVDINPKMVLCIQTNALSGNQSQYANWCSENDPTVNFMPINSVEQLMVWVCYDEDDCLQESDEYFIILRKAKVRED